MPIASDYPLLDVLGSMLVFFMGLAWIAALIAVVVDVLRRHDMGGWHKALWILFVVIAPILGLLVYLVSHSTSMSQRVSASGAPPQSLRGYYDPSPGARAGTPPRAI